MNNCQFFIAEALINLIFNTSILDATPPDATCPDCGKVLGAVPFIRNAQNNCENQSGTVKNLLSIAFQAANGTGNWFGVPACQRLTIVSNTLLRAHALAVV